MKCKREGKGEPRRCPAAERVLLRHPPRRRLRAAGAGRRRGAVGKGGRFKPKRGKAAAVAAREEPLGFPSTHSASSLRATGSGAGRRAAEAAGSPPSPASQPGASWGIAFASPQGAPPASSGGRGPLSLAGGLPHEEVKLLLCSCPAFQVTERPPSAAP